MNFWIFVTTKIKHTGGVLSAEEIYKQRAMNKFWGLKERTPNMLSLRANDQITFYVGFPECTFAGTAVLSSQCSRLSEEDRQLCWPEYPIFRPEYGVKLQDVNIWESPVPVRNILNSLFFVENEECWGTYFQGGIRGLTQEDYRVIVGHE